MRFVVLYICLLIFLGSIAKSSDDSTIEKKTKVNTIIIISYGMTLGVEKGSFFDKMESDLSMPKKGFAVYPNLSVGSKIEIYDDYRLTLIADFFKSSMMIGYQQSVETIEGTGTRTFGHQFIAQTLPIVASIEYVPFFSKQFKTYFGIGAGINFGYFSWDENVFSNIYKDPKKSGVKYNSNYVAPVFRINSGVELGFDKDPTDYFIGSLILELRITKLFEAIDLLNRIKEQYSLEKTVFDESYSVINHYVNLNLAISFNFNNFKRNNLLVR